VKRIEVLSEIIEEARLKKSAGKPHLSKLFFLSVTIKCSVGNLLEVCLKHFLFKNLYEFRKPFGV